MICVWSSWCHCHPVISSFIKIPNSLTFLVPAYPGCPGKEAIERVSFRLQIADFVIPVCACFTVELRRFIRWARWQRETVALLTPTDGRFLRRSVPPVTALPLLVHRLAVHIEHRFRFRFIADQLLTIPQYRWLCCVLMVYCGNLDRQTPSQRSLFQDNWVSWHRKG